MLSGEWCCADFSSWKFLSKLEIPSWNSTFGQDSNTNLLLRCKRQLSQLQGRLVGYKDKYRQIMLCCRSLLNAESVFKLLPVFEHGPLRTFEFGLCKIKGFALWLRESRNISVTRRVLYFCTAQIQMYRKEITMILWWHVFKWVDLVYRQYQWSLDIFLLALENWLHASKSNLKLTNPQSTLKQTILLHWVALLFILCEFAYDSFF